MDARLSPMLASPGDAIPADAEKYAIEPKIDGWRTVVHVEDSVTVYGGRNGNRYNGKVPYIEQAIADALPNGTAIDGEMMCATGGWNAVQSVMTSGAAHRPSPLSPHLTLVVFDVILLNGQDVRSLHYEGRRELLHMIEWPTHTYLVPQADANQAAHIQFIEHGMEGSVLKLRDSRYESGRRSPSWIKLKTVESDEAEIIGFKPGENGRSGEVGAIEVRFEWGATTTASGMNDKERDDMLANPANWLGKTVEISHNGRLPSGSVRHPRYTRRRDDKMPAATPAASTPRPRATGNGGGRRGPAMRNYGAMGTSKLRDCLSQLEGRYGDAYQRVQAGRYAGTYDEHLAACRKAAREKGVA